MYWPVSNKLCICKNSNNWYFIKVYMIVNFKTCKINWDMIKLIQIFMLIIQNNYMKSLFVGINSWDVFFFCVHKDLEYFDFFNIYIFKLV